MESEGQSAVFQMRLTDSDRAALVELSAWYPGLTRAALVRLALVELQRYVRAAARRKAEAAVIAEHLPQSTPAPRAVAKAATDAQGREWLPSMDKIQQERRAQGLGSLSYDALLAAARARDAGE